MWKCYFCSEEFDDSIKKETRSDELHEFSHQMRNVCLRCKWYKYTEVEYGYSEDRFAFVMMNHVPDRQYDEMRSIGETLEFLKSKRRENGIPDNQQVTEEEDAVAETYKSSLLEKYAKGTLKRIRTYKKKKRNLDDQAMRGYDKANEAKKKKEFAGRMRQCKDCGKTFPWQFRKTRCPQCCQVSSSPSKGKSSFMSPTSSGLYIQPCQGCGESCAADIPWTHCYDCKISISPSKRKSSFKSPSSTKKCKPRTCQDCGDAIDACAPKWKVRCMDCWRKNKITENYKAKFVI